MSEFCYKVTRAKHGANLVDTYNYTFAEVTRTLIVCVTIVLEILSSK